MIGLSEEERSAIVRSWDVVAGEGKEVASGVASKFKQKPFSMGLLLAKSRQKL